MPLPTPTPAPIMEVNDIIPKAMPMCVEFGIFIYSEKKINVKSSLWNRHHNHMTCMYHYPSIFWKTS